jgi:hypothetical protein
MSIHLWVGLLISHIRPVEDYLHFLGKLVMQEQICYSTRI